MLLVPVALLGTLVGLLLAPFYSIPQSLGLCLLAGCLPVAFCWRKSPPCLLLTLLLISFLLSNLRYPLQFPADSVVNQLTNAGHKLSITADLLQVTQRTDNRSQLDLQLVEVFDRGELVSLTDTYRLRLYVGTEVTGLLPGERLQFQARLRQPRLFGTPGEFHWPRYLASQGIAMTGWLKGTEQLVVVGSSENFLLRSVSGWKERSAERIRAAVSDQQSMLVRALLLGESRMLPDRVRENLAHAGISHLFAISGLHLGLIGMLGYRMLLFFYRRSVFLLNWQPPQRVLPLLLLPLLFAYLLLTGDAVSTRRAFCVASLVAVFWLGRYSVNPLRLLMFLALFFLLFNPLLLWQPAWQLSFSGAAGILLWRPFWQEKTVALPFWFRAPFRLLLVSTAATLATLPLVLFSFHQLAVSSLLANLIAVPIVTLLALPVGLFGLVFSAVPFLGGLFFSLSGYLLEGILFFVERLLVLPGCSAHYLFLSRGQYLAIAMLMLPLLLCAQRGIAVFLPRITAACLCLALLGGFKTSGEATGLSLYMLSVGQGDSLLLSDAERHAVLIDGGGLYSDRFDVGERLLAPALGELGIHRLSAVLLTHDHPDHRKGLIFIVNQFQVDEFWTAVAVEDLHQELQQVLQRKAIPVRRFPAGWSQVKSWSAGEMQLYHSPDSSNKNDSSLVLYLRSGPEGLLLTGDLEKKGVQRLLATGVPGPVSLLKLPHHGSRHSASDELVRHLAPKFCLVSAGYQNRYGFPARELVATLHQLAVPLYRTDRMGTIRVRVSDGWQVDHWQDGLFR